MESRIIKYLYDKWIPTSVWYMLDSKTRESKKVTAFLEEQLTTWKPLLQEIIDDNNWSTMNDDAKVIAILKWVQKNIKYVSDRVQYKTVEHWAGVNETLATKKGDCEDGAILIFCLARLAGVSEEKIFIAAGDVDGGGHCWVKYISENYVYVSFYLDWCYWYSSRCISRREAFIDYNAEIFPNDRYKKYWFISNDKISARKFNW